MHRDDEDDDCDDDDIDAVCSPSHAALDLIRIDSIFLCVAFSRSCAGVHKPFPTLSQFLTCEILHHSASALHVPIYTWSGYNARFGMSNGALIKTFVGQNGNRNKRLYIYIFKLHV